MMNRPADAEGRMNSVIDNLRANAARCRANALRHGGTWRQLASDYEAMADALTMTTFAPQDGHTHSDHTAARSDGRGLLAPSIVGSNAEAAVFLRRSGRPAGQTSGSAGLTAHSRHNAFGQEQAL